MQTATNEVLRRWRNTSKLQSRDTVKTATREYDDDKRDTLRNGSQMSLGVHFWGLRNTAIGP